ncbi:hypothetical protein AMTR_s00033p00161180 [Amborella trichopoda]|uniref:Uncharacterized protein n=1 Tax=Amborella trichopoda TaxID=13333 RepID=U5D1M8_AMBTC|nr:hypothetical protein AMTR_s00033p00161180 [Amborella trichopoda]
MGAASEREEMAVGSIGLDEDGTVVDGYNRGRSRERPLSRRELDKMPGEGVINDREEGQGTEAKRSLTSSRGTCTKGDGTLGVQTSVLPHAGKRLGS